MITFKQEGKKLTIVADLDGTNFSSSGKNIVLATTNGFTQVEGSDVKVSLNVITKPKR
jgi:hypothetical protein